MRLALEELITNIIKYGYDDSGIHEIDGKLIFRNGTVEVVLRDDGHPFNPWRDAVKTALAPTLSEQEIGGLGVYLVRQLAHDLSYRRAYGCNIVKFRIGENQP